MSQEQPLFEEFPPISREEWEQKIKKDLHGADYKTKLNWETGEGIDALPFYRSDDFDVPPSSVPIPNKDWEIRQPIAEQDVAKANNIARRSLKNGADALEFKFDIRRTEGNIGGGLRGVAIQDQEAFDTLLDGINIKETPLHFASGLNSPILPAMLHNLCEEQNLDSTCISGSLLYDPYAFIITNGFLPKNETDLIDETRQLTQFCRRRMPQMKCLAINAGVYHNAGATIVQEVGCALAAGSDYLAALSETGLDTDIIASAIHFNFAIGSGYFLEIAKFRTLRKLWRTILDEYNVNEDQTAYIHGSTSERNKSTIDPYINMLRSTSENMSAAVAGCDSISIHPFDETFRRPTNFSRRTARNSQLIAKEEAPLNQVADPAAGSYYIETLTDKIAEAGWQHFQEIESQGGLLKSIKGGYPQTVIEKARHSREQAVAQRKRIFIGVNQYPNQDDPVPEMKPKPVVSLIKTDSNVNINHSRLITSLGEALKNGASLGDVVPELFDLGPENIRPIHPYRGPQAFEELRRAAENQPSAPQVLTIPIGNKKMRKARSSFAANFFGCAGYKLTDPIGFDSVNEAVKEIEDTCPDIVVLCSSNKEYEQLIPEFCTRLNELKQKPITVLAGYPKEHIEEYREAGIDEFIFAGSDVLESLKNFHKKLKIIEYG